MSATETVIVVVAMLAATVAAIANSLTPELAGLLGVAIGYGGKGAVTALSTPRGLSPENPLPPLRNLKGPPRG
jgi:hypothetical protein